jgi:hypothetical protein
MGSLTDALTSLQVDAVLSYLIAFCVPALDAILPVLRRRDRSRRGHLGAVRILARCSPREGRRPRALNVWRDTADGPAD